jgi:hypothetical protein
MSRQDGKRTFLWKKGKRILVRRNVETRYFGASRQVYTERQCVVSNYAESAQDVTLAWYCGEIQDLEKRGLLLKRV